MAKRSRRRHVGRSESGGYFALPHAVMASPAYLRLSHHAVALLNNLGAQYRGRNNGDLSAAWSVMQALGWKSRDTLRKALEELLAAGLIEKTRQGGKRVCCLYALTWHPIDECGGKLDCAPTRVASSLWRQGASQKIVDTAGVLSRHGGRVKGPAEAASLTRHAC